MTFVRAFFYESHRRRKNTHKTHRYTILLSKVNTRVSVPVKTHRQQLLQAVYNALQHYCCSIMYTGISRTPRSYIIYYYKNVDAGLRGSKSAAVIVFFDYDPTKTSALVENSPRKIENSNLFSKRFVLKWKKRVRKLRPSNPVRPPHIVYGLCVRYTRTYHIIYIILLQKVYIIREIRRRVLKQLLSPIGRP